MPGAMRSFPSPRVVNYRNGIDDVHYFFRGRLAGGTKAGKEQDKKKHKFIHTRYWKRQAAFYFIASKKLTISSSALKSLHTLPTMILGRYWLPPGQVWPPFSILINTRVVASQE